MAQQEPISPAAADLVRDRQSVSAAPISGNVRAAETQPRSGGPIVERGEPSPPRSPAQESPGPAKRRRPRRRTGEFIIESLIRLCGISAIIFVFAIFFFVFREGAPILGKIDLKKFLFTVYWYPTSLGTPRYGVWALIVGTFSVTALSMILAVPFGLGAAIFVSEFCGQKTKETLKIVIELLAAI